MDFMHKRLFSFSDLVINRRSISSTGISNNGDLGFEFETESETVSFDFFWFLNLKLFRSVSLI